MPNFFTSLFFLKPGKIIIKLNAESNHHDYSYRNMLNNKLREVSESINLKDEQDMENYSTAKFPLSPISHKETAGLNRSTIDFLKPKTSEYRYRNQLNLSCDANAIGL